MKQRITTLVVMLVCTCLSMTAQHILKVQIKDAATREALPGAAVRADTGGGAVADTSGVASLGDIPDGRRTLVVTYVGYESQEVVVEMPFTGAEPLEVLLEPEEV